MKISDLQVAVLRAPQATVHEGMLASTAIVRLRTDEGLSGYGEVCAPPVLIEAMLTQGAWSDLTRGLRPVVVGRDPRDMVVICEELRRGNAFAGRSGLLGHAMGALDIALWDLVGKVLGLPIYQLLGGAFRSQIPLYASHVMPSDPTPVRELAARARSEGWMAQKFGWFPGGDDQARDQALVEAAREGCGPEARLLLDVGQRWYQRGSELSRPWDAKTAIQRVRGWADYRPFWIEEPLPLDDLEGYARLTESVEPLIVAGELESSRHDMFQLMDRGNIDVLHVDVGRVGGITEARRVWNGAQDRNRLVALHCFGSSIARAAAVHAAATAPTALYLEWPFVQPSWLETLLPSQLTVAEGNVSLPDGAGLGVGVDDEVFSANSVVCS